MDTTNPTEIHQKLLRALETERAIVDLPYHSIRAGHAGARLAEAADTVELLILERENFDDRSS